MTIDANGKIWVAVYGGSCIVQIDPETQTELLTVEVPALCPTSVVFGGISLIMQGFHIFHLIFLACRLPWQCSFNPVLHEVFDDAMMLQSVHGARLN